MGLTRALDKYDATRGAKVSTFAYQSIRNSLYQVFMDSSRLIRLPQSAIERIRDLQKVVDTFSERHKRCG